MAAHYIAGRGLRCVSCQRSALNTFASLAGVSLSLNLVAQPRLVRSGTLSRSFATSKHLCSISEPTHEKSLPQTENDEYDAAGNEDTVRGEKSSHTETTKIGSSTPLDPDSSLPWYLRAQGADDASTQHHTRQQIPAVPNDCPQLLNAITEHLFSDIGLDDLRILDLRTMDPPPALGANLLMILGTARSERHLHVSADRFCRWLRSSYKLRPFADGLVGRNEMKLRLKRKAKRAKLLGSKPASDGEADDGLRSGWICVNVGTISNESSPLNELEQAGIVGFRDSQSGVHVVVQMMTEARREELDLEKLWLDALAKQNQQQVQPSDEERPPPMNQAGEVGVSNNYSIAYADNALRSQRQIGPQSRNVYSRKIHTQPMLRLNTVGPVTIQDATDTLEQNSAVFSSAFNNRHSSEKNAAASRARHFQQLELPPLDPQHRQIIQSLESLAPESAVSSVELYLSTIDGSGTFSSSSGDSTYFSRSSTWHLRLWIALYGMLVGHPRCTASNIKARFIAFEQDFPQPSCQVYKLAIEAFVPGPSEAPTTGVDLPLLTRETNAFVSHCLYKMQSVQDSPNTSFLIERSLLAYFRSLRDDDRDTTEELQQVLRPVFGAQRAIGIFGRYKLSEACHKEIMAHLAALSPDLESFFDYWTRIPMHSGSRSADLYAIFFGHVALHGNQAVILQTLDEWVGIMRRESPPIPLSGAVARNLMRCILALEPDIEQLCLEKDSSSHLVELWRRCVSSEASQT